MRTRYAQSATGVNPGDEALPSFKIANAYSESNDATAASEGTAGKKLSIQILKQTVEAKTRRLSARWTFESVPRCPTMHGLDVEAEIMQALAQEIVVEIDQEIIGSLRTLAGAGTTLDFNAVTGTQTYVGDRHAVLAIEINRAANRIAARTRRGAGNYIAVSPEALTILQSASINILLEQQKVLSKHLLTQNLLVSLTDLSKYLLTVMRLTELKF